MKRKHRVMLEITFDKPVTERQASHFVEELCEGDDFRRVAYGHAWRCGAVPTNHVVKNAERVLQQELRRELESRG